MASGEHTVVMAQPPHALIPPSTAAALRTFSFPTPSDEKSREVSLSGISGATMSLTHSSASHRASDLPLRVPSLCATHEPTCNVADPSAETSGGSAKRAPASHSRRHRTTSTSHQNSSCPLPESERDQQNDGAASALAKLQREVHALKVENAVLRQRVSILQATAADVGSVYTSPHTHDGVLSGLGRDGEDSVCVPLLRARLQRLDAALRLESMERERLERRLLAQEGVLLRLQLEKQRQQQKQRGAASRTCPTHRPDCGA